MAGSRDRFESDRFKDGPRRDNDRYESGGGRDRFRERYDGGDRRDYDRGGKRRPGPRADLLYVSVMGLSSSCGMGGLCNELIVKGCN